MTKIAQFLGSCLLVVSMATVAWAGETLGTGMASPSPTPSPEATTYATSMLAPVQDASVIPAEAVSALVSWLVEAIL
jgi:hypothetical protein